MPCSSDMISQNCNERIMKCEKIYYCETRCQAEMTKIMAFGNEKLVVDDDTLTSYGSLRGEFGRHSEWGVGNIVTKASL